jgi:protease-4
VIAEFLQVQDALEKIGVSVRTVKTGRLKDAGSPTRDMTVADEEYFQSLMDEVHQQFVRVVGSERGIDSLSVRALADGRVFTGEEAMREHLIDTLGTFEDAVGVAADLAGISGEPALVREYKRRPWWKAIFGDAVESVTDLKNELFHRPILSYRFAGPT